ERPPHHHRLERVGDDQHRPLLHDLPAYYTVETGSTSTERCTPVGGAMASPADSTVRNARGPAARIITCQRVRLFNRERSASDGPSTRICASTGAPLATARIAAATASATCLMTAGSSPSIRS